MHLKSIHFKNFRGFKEQGFSFSPGFNLIVGENGSGKTSVLEGTAIAIGSWLLGFPGYDSRNIRNNDVYRECELVNKRYRVLPQYPVVVRAAGCFLDIDENEPGACGEAKNDEKVIEWERSLNYEGGRTTTGGAKDLRLFSEMHRLRVLNKNQTTLPIIRYFGAGRLWESVRSTENKTVGKRDILIGEVGALDSKLVLSDPNALSPFGGYRLSVDKRCNPYDLIQWLAFERRVEIDDEEPSPSLRTVYDAIDSMLPEARSVRYSIKLNTLVFNHGNGKSFLFEDLSDGYRNVLSMAADLAVKAVMLNPHLGHDILKRTPGVVLIDELDLHLHPKWQRRIVDDLRRTFPKIQFIATTHSPFIIQAIKPGELISLTKANSAEYSDQSIEDIAENLMGVDVPQKSQRYLRMIEAAEKYYTLLRDCPNDSKSIDEAKVQLDELALPFSDDAAFQSLLKLERKMHIGRNNAPNL